MNIMLIGERYSPNLGDGVIYDTVEAMCYKIYGSKITITCVDISGNNKYKKSSNIETKKEKIKFLLTPLRKVLSRLKREFTLKERLKKIELNSINGAIFVGGQIYSNYFIKQIYIISKKLNKLNIPIIFNCCGIGNINKKNEKVLKDILSLNNVKAVSLRDNYNYFGNAMFNNLTD